MLPICTWDRLHKYVLMCLSFRVTHMYVGQTAALYVHSYSIECYPYVRGTDLDNFYPLKLKIVLPICTWDRLRLRKHMTRAKCVTHMYVGQTVPFITSVATKNVLLICVKEHIFMITHLGSIILVRLQK